MWSSTHRTYSNHNVNVQNTFADETSRAECIQPPWCLLLRDALPERRRWTSGGKLTSRSLQNFLSWSLCQNIVPSQCRFLVTSTDCYVRKSHLQQGLLLSHEGGASIVVVTVSGMWHCTLDGWMAESERGKGPFTYDVHQNFRILYPLTPCPQIELIYSTKSTQPPVRHLLLDQPPLHPQCGRHMWTAEKESRFLERCHSLEDHFKWQ